MVFSSKEAEAEPLQGELQQLLVIAAERLHPGLVNFKQFQETRLEDEAPEAVQVVASHVEHFHLLAA